MKIKNIAFSGIMAAILMGTAGANAAVEIASKQYVISQTSDKATTDALNTAKSELQSAIALKASQESLDATNEEVAKKANAADVYTKEEANGLLASKADVDNVWEKAKSYSAEQVDAKISETIASLESGGSIELGGYAKTQDVEDALALKADKTAVEAITTSLNDYAKTTYVDSQDAATLQSAKTYADEKVTALTGENGALTTLEAKVATKADASTVETLSGKVTANETAIGQNATAISGLSGQISALGDTYATDAEVSGVKTELQGNIDAKVATSDYNTKVGELETAIAGNKTATETNAAAIKTINDGAVMNSGITSEKVGQYDQAVTDLTKKITMPEICMSKNCVLSTLNGEIQWVEITIPVGNEE